MQAIWPHGRDVQRPSILFSMKSLIALETTSEPSIQGTYTHKNRLEGGFQVLTRGLRLSTTGFRLPLKRSFPQRGFGAGHVPHEAT